jgi:hypothetical protein
MPQVSPIRVIRTTRLWIPLAALLTALGLFGVSGIKGWSAHQYETRGELAQALVLRKERRETRDSDGNRKVSYHVSYRYETAGGETLQRRRQVRRSFYDSVSEGRSFALRYLPDRPTRHEFPVGATRAEAGEFRSYGLLALAATGALGLWFGLRALPLVRALAGGRLRQARVTGHVEKPARRKETGGRYGRVRWVDETGAEGESGWVPMLDVVSHPVGSRIRVVVDPATGRTWWEEEFADDMIAELQRG